MCYQHYVANHITVQNSSPYESRKLKHSEDFKHQENESILKSKDIQKKIERCPKYEYWHRGK